jgi:hypothetical protein
MAEPPAAVTALLQGWHDGAATALDPLTPLVYDELCRRARYDLRDERPRDTPRPAAHIPDTVTRDWQMATLWLRRELGRRKAGP